jgi:hypothetical protein
MEEHNKLWIGHYGSVTTPRSAGNSFVNTNFTATLSDLLAGQEYHYRIAASNACGLATGLDQRFWTQTFTNSVILKEYFGGRIYWGDFNNDGWIDPLALMTVYTNGDTFLFKNIAGLFTNQLHTLPRTVWGEGAWGDYNGDGRQDILLSGISLTNYGYSAICKIFRNDGAGAFTEVDAGLPGIVRGGVAWGDFDNDGELDMALCGGAYFYGPVMDPITRIYRNDGGVFTNIGADLPAVGNASVAWGDYDNDGRLDLLLAGDTGTGCVARVYHNNDDMFTDISAGLIGVASGSVAWGDYDGDGWLDILLAGSTNGSSDGAVCRIYRNNHDGTFTDINANLPGVFQGGAAWGDLDNDGLLDALLTGIVGGGTGVYLNVSGQFVDIGAGLSVYGSGTGAWGDYDGDGNLDVAIGGGPSYPNAGGGLLVFHNCIASSHTTTNQPTAPRGLVASVANNGVRLSWSAAADPHTPTPGLTYNVRIGTTPGGAQVLSSQSDPVTGRLLVPQMGNAQHRLFTTITNLPSGVFYWSVQTVNNGFVGSIWPAEQMFAAVSGAPTIVTIASQPGSKWLLKCAGAAGSHYTLEASTDLSDWTALASLVAGPDGMFEFLDVSASNLTARFYRLKAH